MTASELRALLAAHGLRLHKRLGQNYLIDANAIARIVAACELTGQETVLEIGAGLGALTAPLAQQSKHVVTYEIDRGIGSVLTQRLASVANVTIRLQDITEASWDEWTRQPVVVVGAIPYHITSGILVMLCEQHSVIQRAVLVLQEEVAKRIVAPAGTKTYGRLSVLMRYYWQIVRQVRVPRHVFFPQPEVDSICLVLAPAPQRVILHVENELLFFNVVKAAFAQRRKTLINSLSESPLKITRSQATAWLTQLKIPLTVRGEVLDIPAFAQLSNLMNRHVLQ